MNAIYIYFFGTEKPKTFVVRDTLMVTWSLIDGRRSLSTILEEIRETFNLKEAEAVMGLKEAMAFLKNENLITMKVP